jgi:hypothetical protein
MSDEFRLLSYRNGPKAHLRERSQQLEELLDLNRNTE